MSEYPVGTKVDKFRFINRNRLIIGLSKVVVIYECDAKGGTMHNVEFALQQNKLIFAQMLEKIFWTIKQVQRNYLMNILLQL